MYQVVETDNTNTLPLSAEGDAIAIAPTAKCVVVLKDVSLASLRNHFRLFEAELRSALYEAFAKTKDEFAQWHHAGDRAKVRFKNTSLPRNACVGFRVFAATRPVLAILNQPIVMKAAISAGLVKHNNVTGGPRQINTRGLGHLGPFCQRLPLKTQRELLQRILLDKRNDLDDTLSITQSDCFDLKSIASLLASCTTAVGALEKLAEHLQQPAKSAKRSFARGAGQHWGPVWFLMFWSGKDSCCFLCFLTPKMSFLGF